MGDDSFRPAKGGEAPPARAVLGLSVRLVFGARPHSALRAAERAVSGSVVEYVDCCGRPRVGKVDT